jgi:hypothetical protein
MWRPARRRLLALDALINLVLGLSLLSFPAGVLEFLGLPPVHTYFYTSLLGAVLFGIGIALCIELWGASKGMGGLGLEGAVSINFCGAGVLLVWLLIGGLPLPLRGRALLWAVALVVLAIGIVEMGVRPGKEKD